MRVGPLALRAPEGTASPAPKPWVSSSHEQVNGRSRVRKRAYIRAMKRLRRHGHTQYRGQDFYEVGDFGSMRDDTGTSMPDGRSTFFTWNCSGLSPEVLAETLAWASGVGASFFSLQETHWNFSSDWRSDGWLFVHSAAAKAKSGGVLFAIRSDLVDANSVRWTELVPGRLLQVRCLHNKQTVDFLTLYQHVKSCGDAADQRANIGQREGVWRALEKALSALPCRSYVVLAGDFNTSFSFGAPLIGKSAVNKEPLESYQREAARVQDMLGAKGLVALNTFGKRVLTYVHPKGSSLIDFILVRRPVADARARKACAVKAPLAAWRTVGHKPVVASLRLDWRPWLNKTRGSLGKKGCHYGGNRTLNEFKQGLERHSTSQHQQLRFSPPALERPLGLVRDCWLARRAYLAANSHTLKAIFEKFCLFARYQKAQRVMRAAARGAKRKRMLEILSSAEEAASRGDSRALHRCVKLLSNQRGQARVRLKGEHGELITGEEECRTLTKYAEKLFTGEAMGEMSLQPLRPHLLSAELWHAALRALRSGKAVPQGEPSIELWKDNLQTAAQELSKISIECLCCESPEIPAEWSYVQLAWLAKPGKSPCTPKNLRSVGLLSADSKAFLLVLRGHMEGPIRRALSDAPQYAYRPGLDTNNAILRAISHCKAVRQLLKQAVRNHTSRVMGALPPELQGGLLVSLDMSKAFDSVPHQELFLAMRESNVEESIARLVMQVHIQTVCWVRHAGHEGSCGMSRGLRQGCPIAPILYVAWSSRMCRQLRRRLGDSWRGSHLSMFADDILGFWEITSVVSLRKASSELLVLLQTLRDAGMTINADKSVALLGLAGIKKSRALKEHTEMVKQAQYLKVADKKDAMLIPMVEVIPYLGVQLSYGQFEAQTVQHRIEQAVTRSNILSSVLRTTSKFSAKNRTRIYKCCVWASLRYGLFAAGLNQAGFNRIVATLCMHLRKVLRIHEHGVSNQQVLQHADLDPMQFFVDSGRVLLERISSDNTRPSEIRDIEKTAAEANLRILQSILVDQPHSSLIETDPAFIQGGCVCQTCGLTFANEAGLAMHVKSKHSEIHLKAGVEFNRGSHSLYGVPIWRLCRRHLHDWSSMAKHITAGTCPRLKDALAQGLSHDELLLEVIEQERLNPPSMPVAMQEVEDIGEYAEWMDAPIEHMLQDSALHRRLKSGCAICKQRLVGINRVKTHWQLSHKAAWDKISSTIRGSLRSLSSVFRSPCQFCGSRAKDASAHAVQCPVMYQALAIRELHSVMGMADARKESTPTRARQDKANPQYMRFDVATIHHWAGLLAGHVLRHVCPQTLTP